MLRDIEVVSRSAHGVFFPPRKEISSRSQVVGEGTSRSVHLSPRSVHGDSQWDNPAQTRLDTERITLLAAVDGAVHTAQVEAFVILHCVQSSWEIHG